MSGACPSFRLDVKSIKHSMCSWRSLTPTSRCAFKAHAGKCMCYKIAHAFFKSPRFILESTTYLSPADTLTQQTN